MDNNKGRQKRLKSRDTGDKNQPPPKQKKVVPEDQLKLERVLKSASKDSSIISKIQHKKDTGNTSKSHSSRKKSGVATEGKTGQSSGSNLREKSAARKAVGADQSHSPKSDKPSEKKTLNGKSKQSEYFTSTSGRPTRTKESKTSKTVAKQSNDVESLKNHDKKKIEKSEYFQKSKTKASSSTKLKEDEKDPVPEQTKNPTKTQSNAAAANKTSKKSNGKVTTQKQSSSKSGPKPKKGPSEKELKTGSRGRRSKDTPVLYKKVAEFPHREHMKREALPIPVKRKRPATTESITIDDSSDSEESDWEEVKEPNAEPQLPSEPVTITLKGPDLMSKKRRRTQADIQSFIRRRINRADQELQLQMHKVHLLCLLSHGFHRNRTCLDLELQAHALSVVPTKFAEREAVHWDVTYLKNLLRWFQDFFTIEHDLNEYNIVLKQILINRIATREVASEAELVFLMLIILRSLGAQVRLVTSLQPVSYKSSRKLKNRKAKPEGEEDDEDDFEEVQNEKPSQSQQQKPDTPSPKPAEENSEVMAMLQAMEGNKQVSEKGPDKSQSAKLKNEKASTSNSKAKNLKRRTSASKVDGPGKQKGSRKSSASRDSSPEIIELSDLDVDFEEHPKKLRKSPSLIKGKKKKSKRDKMVSSDSDDVTVTKVVKKDTGTDYFVEVYVERAESWIPVDCIRCKVNCVSEIESRATQPVYYVLAYDNDQCIKDVTSRYASGWMSTTRKLRKDEDWWDEVLHPFRPRNKTRDDAENARLQNQQLRKPMPTSITQLKNHPLYALKRHLLKFEGIYPSNAVPAGYIKGEPVYPRESVHELHTREAWLKEGRAVRVKEKPYKLVKARKKRSRKGFEEAASQEGEKQAECFGRWQTEQYMPPPCFNGKVPRNEYGNIEIFKPWMIPPGGVHLQIPGLKQVARKLNIDCAPAMVGWDFHGGFNHPIMDGFIVCEEHKDILLAAWDEEQEIIREKEEEKRELRALANWKKMVKSLLIRERMKKRFDLQDPKPKTAATEGGSREPEQKAQDTQYAWPANRPDFVKKLSTADQSSLFPSEEI